MFVGKKISSNNQYEIISVKEDEEMGLLTPNPTEKELIDAIDNNSNIDFAHKLLFANFVSQLCNEFTDLDKVVLLKNIELLERIEIVDTKKWSEFLAIKKLLEFLMLKIKLCILEEIFIT